MLTRMHTCYSMASKNNVAMISSHLQQSTSWVKAGYWDSGNGLPASDINSALFTHLICYAASLDSSTFHLHISRSDQDSFSTFSTTVKNRNPSVTTLLCISVENDDSTIISSMMSCPSQRKSFIESSIKTARLYGFQGLELDGYIPLTASEAANMGVLLDEWRAAVSSETTDSGEPPLMLTLSVNYVPVPATAIYPIDSMRRNLDWVHVVAYNYHRPSCVKYSTHVHAALYEPLSQLTVDFAVGSWISRGLPEKKLVLGLAYHGFAWKLVNPDKENGIGAAASGPAVSRDGYVGYKYIKSLMRSLGVASFYDDTYAANYCSFGETWIGYDDIEAIRAKVSYAKEKGLLGFLVWHISLDDNWVLSLAAGAVLNEEVTHANQSLDENHIAKSDKAEISGLLQSLTSMRYNGKGNIKEYIVKMSRTISKLKTLNIEYSEDVLVHLVLNSLGAQFNEFKVSYNNQKEKWSLSELILFCVQEEERLKHGKLESAHLASTSKNKGENKKRNIDRNEAVRSVGQKKRNNDKYAASL